MRVNKELRTLSQKASVTLLALGERSQCYAEIHVEKLVFVEGSRKAVSTLLRYIVTGIYLLVSRRYHSVHVINEPQLIIFWPFLWFQKRVVLDIFDSIFLRKNRPGNQLAWLKKIVYAPLHQALVTDENRLELLPDFLKKNARIVPNYPYRLAQLPLKERSAGLRVMYFGWLGELRGTQTIAGLLAADPALTVWMAGWLTDDASRELTQHPRVRWLGVIPQAEALNKAAQVADYILCVYAPINDNNINASPNKIYDAIQTCTPVIINAEVKVSAFVTELQLGHVIPSYEVTNYQILAQQLLQKRNTFTFKEEIRQAYTWEKVEERLHLAHDM